MRHLHDMKYANKQNIKHAKCTFAKPNQTYWRNLPKETPWSIVSLAILVSSPRAKRVGPKGLRAESARAVTGRWCPHSGEGEDFLSHQPDFFTKTAVTLEWKVGKSIPRWEMNGLSEGYKWVIDQNWGHMAKIGFFGQKPRFWAQKSYTS